MKSMLDLCHHVLISVLLSILSLGPVLAADGRISTHDLTKRAKIEHISPDDVHLWEAAAEILKALKGAAGSEELPPAIQSNPRFLIGGGVAVNHWSPNHERPVKVKHPK